MTLLGLLLSSAVLTSMGTGDAASLTPADLVARLGSSRFEDRESASRLLIERGRDSIGDLVRSRNSADPEVALRVEWLLDRIEHEQVRQPTRIPLGRWQGQPVGIALRDLRDVVGLPFEIEQTGDPAWLERQLAIDPPSSLPFWDALERLGVEGRWSLEPAGGALFAVTEPTFRVGPAGSRARLRATSGPLQASLRELMVAPREAEPGRLRGFGQAAGRLPRAENDRLVAVFEFASEPSRAIAEVLSAECLEATDSNGRSLLADRGGEGDVIVDRTGNSPSGPAPVVPVSFDLKAPAQGGDTLKRVRISARLTLEARRLAPQEVSRIHPDREDEFPAPIECEGSVITRARLVPSITGQGQALELVIRPEGWNQLVGRRNMRRRVDLLAQQVERLISSLAVADDAGRGFTFHSPRLRFEPGEVVVSIGLEPSDRQGKPTTLLHHGTIREDVDAEFELHDLPIGLDR